MNTFVRTLAGLCLALAASIVTAQAATGVVASEGIPFTPVEEHTMYQRCKPDLPVGHTVTSRSVDQDGKPFAAQRVIKCVPPQGIYFLLLICNNIKSECIVRETRELCIDYELRMRMQMLGLAREGEK